MTSASTHSDLGLVWSWLRALPGGVPRGRPQCGPILVCHNLDVWCQKKVLRRQSRATKATLCMSCSGGFWHDSCTHLFEGHLLRTE